MTALIAPKIDSPKTYDEPKILFSFQNNCKLRSERRDGDKLQGSSRGGLVVELWTDKDVDAVHETRLT